MITILNHSVFNWSHLKITNKMRTTSMDLFSASPTPSVLQENPNISSGQPCVSLNSTTWPPIQSKSDLWISCFTMAFGAISNLTALVILFQVQSQRQSKPPYLLLTMALLLADLGAHVIPGVFAVYLHLNPRHNVLTKEFCQIFGASMVFFGLCPLLLGFAMAVERCVAITQPFFHAAMITSAVIYRVVLFLTCLAFVLALLPFFGVGTYCAQSPRTWCFLQISGPQTTADINLALAFSCLGLTALTVSLLCNVLSGVALLQARKKLHDLDKESVAGCTRRVSTTFSSCFSMDVEMMAQLAVITVVSCVCWSPFLTHILVMQLNPTHGPSTKTKDGFLFVALRMASWNQSLDPWVYILLRKAVLSTVCSVLHKQKPSMTAIH